MTDSDKDFIADVLPAFISEALEQVVGIEQLLLQLEDAPDDRELLDALFRCAHTVKGSAGIFGLNDVVGFTHHVESLLDLLREAKIVLTPELSTLLLQCNDQIHELVNAASDGSATTSEAAETSRLLVQRLHAASQHGAPDPVSAEAGVDATLATPATTATGLTTNSERWHVSVRFGPDTFRNGMDPLSIINYLGGMGRIAALACDTEAVPTLDAIDPETCHLGFEFGFETSAPRDQIDAAFSFVRDDIVLQLIEPGAGVANFLALIDSMPDFPRLGDILVAVGAISRTQLAHGLALQVGAAATAGSAPPLGEILQQDAGLSPLVVNAALSKQAQQRGRDGGNTNAAPPGDDTHFIRVQADRLDLVINLLGELVIAGAGAALLARQTRQSSLIEANAQISRLIEDIRNGTLQLRMVPIGETFARFRRVVRDTAAELGKDVQFEILGGETELDKSVVERIADPLMHLVRNALDHGLELPAERLANGKTAQGKLTLSACHESGSILIRIIDDGRGINRERVLARAWERGLVENGVTPPDADILKLIFEAGFSTAEKVTNLSGRGVGMDVVRRNIEALRGTVTVYSDPGEGSRIEIRLPLTLAIIDGFLVGVGASKFIFPLESVVEVIEARSAISAPDGFGRRVVELRGRALPVLDLRALYGLDSAEPERVSVVVIKSGSKSYGVMVDVLLGQHQTVIKPLGRMFRSLRGMSGSSILGSGEVALIFDVNSLCSLAEQAAAVPGHAPPSPPAPHCAATTSQGQTS
ncbi:chemotaxis protein CheA [Aquabacterium sp.]|uniref:chemotaxis protein CheA n=1 Tax=Aquabacterium sp. TaxID=1872578 RepID=UPI002488C720|nr:chemotaxis protein CheA [Aquabacterium sp.]MDI1261420.1 chemotaxis protein CheA [Aquabacterium sp.]